MAGLAPELPLRRDDVDGYRLIKNFQSLVQQNFKMLMLTAPGERVMDPHFGVGLRNYLFENNSPGTYDAIRIKVNTQVAKYLSYLKIVNISFGTMGVIDNISGNILDMNIEYFITPLGIYNDINFELDYKLESAPFL